MSLSPSRVRFGVLSLTVLSVIGGLAGCGTSSPTSPTHVAALFTDGLDHGDFRQACAQHEAGRKNMAQCVGYTAYLVAIQGAFHWRVVRGSTVVDGDSASVKIATGTATVTAHLSRVSGRWVIVGPIQ